MTTRTVSQLQKHWHAGVVAVIGFIVSIALFYAIQIQEERHILSIAQLGIETIDNNIDAELSFDAHVLKHISNQIQQLGKPNEASTLDLLHAYPRILALAEVSPKLTMTWVVTKKMLAVDPQMIKAFVLANDQKLHNEKLPWVDSPVRINDEKSAFYMVLPFAKGEATHYLVAIIDSYTLLNHSTRLPGITFLVQVNGKPLLLNDPHHYKNNWMFSTTQIFYGATWNIKAEENTIDVGLIHLINQEASLSWITLILGIFISLILARSVALSDLLNERSIVLDKMNQDLTQEITEHLQTEESKKNLEKALLQGQKLQAIGTLAGGIAHDFNNILYAIRGYIELAREDVPKDGIIYKNLGKVLDGTQRGRDLIGQILAFSRRQHHELSPLKLKAEIEGALALLRAAIPESVEMQFESRTEGPIIGNKTQIHQVIVNLISNAVDAMDGEGLITIKLTQVLAGDAVLKKIPQFANHNYAKIEIIDTGYGMDSSTIERIFEPFYTTKEVGRGTGLGLSTAHTIIKEHQGEITVSSQVGHGATFTIFFPEME